MRFVKTRGRLTPAVVLSFVILAALPRAITAQIIEFQSNGLRYQAMTLNGLTLMFAPVDVTVKDYAVMQVSCFNGSGAERILKPTDFVFRSAGGASWRGAPESEVIQQFWKESDFGTVMKLQAAYEKALYGNEHIRPNNGYEARRRAAMASGNKAAKAAAAAGAISLVTARLGPGDSTDGAVFFPNGGEPLGQGQLTVRVGDDVFVFPGGS